MERDLEIISRLNNQVERIMNREEKNLNIPVVMRGVQGSAKKLGINNSPIYCIVEGLNKDENEGSLLSNDDHVFFIDEIGGEKEGFVKLYLFGAGSDEFATRDEFKQDFFILC